MNIEHRNFKKILYGIIITCEGLQNKLALMGQKAGSCSWIPSPNLTFQTILIYPVKRIRFMFIWDHPNEQNELNHQTGLLS
jgi:hypothetical protein